MISLLIWKPASRPFVASNALPVHFARTLPFRCFSSLNRERNHLRAGMAVTVIKDNTVPALAVAALPAYQAICLFPLCWCHAVKGTVLPALYGRQSFIWVLSHVFPPFFLCRSLRKGFLPHSCGVFQRWHAPRTSGHFVPKWLVAVLPLSGYSFSDGYSFFKVQLIDELP